jgi:putative ABC transport system permease protein
MVVAGLAVIIGGIGMTNTLFMSVFERTREIGFLRSLGWRQRRVLGLILGESVVLALLGGLVGSGLGVVAVLMVSRSGSWLGVFGSQLTPDLFARGLVTVVVLGVVGGAYTPRGGPAASCPWRRCATRVGLEGTFPVPCLAGWSCAISGGGCAHR